MSMSPEVERAYHDAMRRAVLRHGALIATGVTFYGWIADDWKHKHECELTTTAIPQEDEWFEFDGTFAPSRIGRGVTVSEVSCRCGKLVNRRVRWEASPSTMIEAVFTEHSVSERLAVTELRCLRLVPGCLDCADTPVLVDHVCDELCRVDGQARRHNDEFHRLIHTPIRCFNCDGILIDRRGDNFYVRSRCVRDTCDTWSCRWCGAEVSILGPIDCLACLPESDEDDEDSEESDVP